MARTEQIIIEVDVNVSDAEKQLGDVTKRIEELKQRNTELRNQRKTDTENWATLTSELKKNELEIKNLKAAEKDLSGQIAQSTQQRRTYSDSFKGQAAMLADLKDRYSSLTKVERESAQGKEMLKKLKELDTQVKENDKSMGNFQRNVGNYPQWMGGFGQTAGKVASVFEGGFTNALKSAGTQVVAFGKTLLTTPIGWITALIGVLIAAFQKLQQAFKNNDEASTRLGQAMAQLKPIGEAISFVFDKLAVGVSKLVQGFMNAVTWVLKLVPAYKEAAREAENLVVKQDRLEESQRNFTLNQAFREKEIAKIKKEALNEEKYSAKEREAMLRRADDLEKKNLEERKYIAKQEYDIFVAKAKQDKKTDDETMNRKAELWANMQRAETEYLNGTLRIESRRQSAIRDMRAKEEKEAEEAEKRRIERQRINAEKEKDLRIRTLAEFNTLLKNQVKGLKTALDAEALIIETATTNAGNKLNATLTDANKSATENYRNELQNKLDATIEGSNAELSARLEILDYQMMQELSAKELTERQKNKIVEKYTKIEAEIRRETLQNQLSATANAFGQIQGLFEEGTRAAKITESAQVAINSISGAIAAFKSVAGVPGIGTVLGAAAAAGVIASGAAAIKKIWEVDEKNGAQSVSNPIQGVKGSGVGSTNTSALQTNVINPEQQASINSKIATGTTYSGGFDYEMLAKALSKQPAPVMVYEEFKGFKGRLATYREQTKI